MKLNPTFHYQKYFLTFSKNIYIKKRSKCIGDDGVKIIFEEIEKFSNLTELSINLS